MQVDGNVQVAVFHDRPSSPDNGALIAEMGGGEGNLVRLLGAHWSIEGLVAGQTLVGFALSSNPEHLPAGAGAFDFWLADKALYARAVWISNFVTSGYDSIGSIYVPLYGIIRPRRQIIVWTIINGEAATGFNLEVYYQPTTAPFTEREEVNRKYGKYRRS